jgi:hypothetical protein
MTDDINKKILIDIEIGTDGQQQIQQYKAAFDNLRNTINNLNSPLNNISKSATSIDKGITNLNTSINKLNSSSSSFASTIYKIGAAASSSLSNFVGLSAISQQLQETGIIAEGFTAELTGGISLLISFIPVIVDWVSSLFNADTATKSLTQALSEHKLVLQAVNQARLQGDQNAQGELVNLKLLYNASQDHNLSLKDRKNAVDQLQQQYPNYFGNISSELILTGKATKAYKDLTQAILDSSRAKAAEDMMVDNQKRQLSDSAKKADLQDQIKDKQAELAQVGKAFSEQEKKADRGRGSFNHVLYDKMRSLRDEIIELQKQSNDASNDAKILDAQNQKLADTVSKNIEKDGVQVLTGNTNNNITTRQTSVSNQQTSSPVPAPQPASPQTPSPLPKQTDDALSPEDAAELNAAQPAANNQNSTSTIKVDLDAIHQIDDARKQAADKAKEYAQQQKDFELQTAQQVSSAAFSILNNSIKQQSDAKINALENDKDAELNNSALTSAQKAAITEKYKQQEDQVKIKAFKDEQEASIAQAVINGALAVTKATSQTGVLSPFVVPEIIAETAVEVAKIASQKPPAYAAGGLHYTSDGKGGVLPGYSRTDNTNAYLRSGEGIVVSEAMRAPWARNLVSAINVGFGGRNFATAAAGRGFAVGGIFTDGGDANRYYNAPVNDQKNLSNSIAYQMINNFPPVYVDVKDINNQQNILAQTINRVNL